MSATESLGSPIPDAIEQSHVIERPRRADNRITMMGVRLRALYRHHFREIRRERQFLASLSFFVTFAITRAITHSMRDGASLFRSVFIGETHVHHLVWGILLLLVVGYGWLVQLGTGANPEARRASRMMSALYGIGAALTLDEFAMWLHLEDVYWERQGRASIDAVLMFGALVSLGLWGGPFLRAAWRQIARLTRREIAHVPPSRPPGGPPVEPRTGRELSG